MSPTTLEQLRSKQLVGTTRLSLACGLREFPREIFDLADSLEILDLSGNTLESLPDDFYRLHKLKIAFFTNNKFKAFPEVLTRCPKLTMISFKSNGLSTISETALSPTLQWLILTDNQLEKLPATIGKLEKLQKLALAGNMLRELPDQMAYCKNLELVRLSVNQLPDLPEWFFRLPKLAWPAFANNPFAPVLSTSEETATAISWKELTLKEVLGQGGSGIISKALWHQKDGSTREVAVKLYKGAITADGLPLDEMRAGLAMGAHPNLVRVLGALSDVPEGKQGLVFALNAPDFSTLAGPPDFATCTRDIYNSEISYSLDYITKITSGIAAAAAHLHARGILHGDLYAHNIQVTAQGKSLLGDFGAACFYDKDDAATARAMEQLEVRAFGYLLEELLTRTAETKAELNPLYTKLCALRDACLHEIVAERPVFEQILEAIPS